MTLGSNTSGHLFDTTFTTNGVLHSAASGVITSTAAGTTGNILISQGAGAAPIYSSQPVIASGIVTNSSQYAFSAYLNATASNVTGDTTAYTILFNTEVFDIGSNYNTGTGTFTAPVTGKYLLTFGVYVNGGTIISSNIMQIVTTTRTYNAYPAPYPTGTFTGVISVIADMTATNTAVCKVAASDTGGKIDDVYGDASMNTYFQGYLLA